MSQKEDKTKYFSKGNGKGSLNFPFIKHYLSVKHFLSQKEMLKVFDLEFDIFKAVKWRSFVTPLPVCLFCSSSRSVTPSSPREGLVVPDLSVEIRTLLSSYYKER